MLAGWLISVYSVLPFLSVVRSRKVKCNRIPGQDKVPHISYVSQPSAYHFWASCSARSVLIPAMFNILTCATALHVQELSMHVRATWVTITYIILTFHSPCRHFVQQATSEKKRMTVNRRRNLSSANSRWVPCQQLWVLLLSSSWIDDLVGSFLQCTVPCFYQTVCLLTPIT